MLSFGNKEFRNLQEQVLKNAQDIETLKGRENLQIVIVEELPEVGNPNYIYLVPNNNEEESNVYDEYIWLADEERYEKIGGVSIDLTNYVNLDSEQTISGQKTFKMNANETTIKITNTNDPNNYTEFGRSGGYSIIKHNGTNRIVIGSTETLSYNHFRPGSNNGYDLGSTSSRWKDIWLAGIIDFGNNASIQKDVSNRINFYYNGAIKVKVGENDTYFANNVSPDSNNNYDLGSSSIAWRNAYIAGNISDGVNTVSVSNIASKVTSTSATGTFDSNGESTILAGASISEGLYIFTYGNCECVVRLTATMIQSSDVTPIRVACPMIVSGSPSLGWLHIAKSGDNLIISVKDSNDHVDSGFAWTLTKTNLL